MAHRSLTAKEMMEGIYSETAQQLLNVVLYHSTYYDVHKFNIWDLRSERPPADPFLSTMLPELDEHILSVNDELNISGIKSPLKRGDVIEIQGPAASGKTQLLYHLAACCILPVEVVIMSDDSQAEFKLRLGGWNRSTVVLDCDGRWNIRRLHEILVARLNLALSKVPLSPLPHKVQKTVSHVALDSLTRLHLFRPTSSVQLVATLLHLPKYHSRHMQNEEIRLLFVDSISSFHWADRWQAEPSGSKKSHSVHLLGNVLLALQAFRLSHGPIMVLTNWGLNSLHSAASSSVAASSSTSVSASTPFFRQHLAAPFPAPLDEPPRRPPLARQLSFPINCHITLPASFIPQLHFDNSDNRGGHEANTLTEALRDQRRKEVVNRGEIEGYVRIPHNNRGGNDVPQKVGRFKFRILNRDIVATSMGDDHV